MMKSMITDDREILSIGESTGQHDIARVGSHGVTKIVVYEEEYNESVIPFMAVYKGIEIAFRIPAKDLAIFYI